MKPVEQTYQVNIMPKPHNHEVNYMWKVSMFNCEKLRQMTLNTSLQDVLNALRSSFLPLPPMMDSSMKDD